ncbi:MAG: tetratricopeptide repeat protein [Leptospiraceae bacterium]|nr:tetratricopeptide repeat protein [Leptospiraceae bacterium]
MLGLLWASVVAAQSPTALDYYQRGMADLARPDYRQAAWNFRQAITRNANYTAAWYGAGLAYFSIGAWDESIQHFREFLRLAPENIDGLNGLALVFMQVGQLDAADQLLGKAAAIERGNLQTIHNRGVLAWHRNRLAIAQKYFEQVLRIAPSYLPSVLGLAHIAFQKGDVDQLGALLDRASRINPDHFEIFLLRGLESLQTALRSVDPLVQKEAIEIARRNLLAAEQLNPGHERTVRELLLLDLLEGQSAQAWNRSEALLAQHSKSAKYLQLYATLAVVQGRTSSAVRALQQILALTPNDSFARYKLEGLLLQDRAANQAELRSLAAWHGDLARTYYAQNQLTDFVIHYRRALTLNADCAVCLQELQKYARQINDMDSYVLLLRRQIRLNPANARLRLQLDRALQQQSRSLESRFHLALDDTAPGVRPIPRNSTRIFIFDPLGAPGLQYHPDGPAAFANLLADLLNQPGPVLATSSAFRSEMHSSMQTPLQVRSLIPWLYPYQSDWLPYLDRLADQRQLQIDRVLSGTIESNASEIRLQIQVIDRRTGRKKESMSWQEQEPGALWRIAGRVQRYLYTRMPVRGQVLQKVQDQLLVNLGRMDGIQKDSQLTVVRNGITIGQIQVTEVDQALALAKAASARSADINPGDIVWLER